MKANLSIWLVFLISHFGFAQQWKKIQTLNFDPQITNVSIDRQGNFYTSVESGSIDKYDRDGALLYHFSPSKNTSASMIEAWQGLKVFAFYKDFQEYLFLNRFLGDSERYTIEVQNTASYFSLVTLSADNNLWVFDAQDLSLQKLDINNKETIVETRLNLNLASRHFNITFIREYQNMVFLADKAMGILVFDNIGNYLETLPIATNGFFSFTGSELITITEGKAVFFDLYTKQKKEIGLPDLSYTFILKENNRIFLFSNNRLDIFETD